MHNSVFLVGRLTTDPVCSEVKDGKKVSNMCLAVTRSYKNEKGEYPVDFIDVSAWQGLAEKIPEFARKGDLVGMRGFIASEEREVDGYKRNFPVITADKVSVLSSNHKEKEVEKSDDLEV